MARWTSAESWCALVACFVTCEPLARLAKGIHERIHGFLLEFGVSLPA